LPLPQIGNITATLSLGADFKRYRQTSYNTNEYFFEIQYFQQSVLQVDNAAVPAAQPPLLTGVDYFPLNVGLNGSVPDKFGTTFFNANVNFNLLPICSEESIPVTTTNVVITVLTNGTTASVTNRVSTTRISHGHSLAGIAYTPGARPHYVTLQLGVDRVQTISRDWSVKLHGDGQWANTPLISDEQYAMGGTAGVRGYTDGEFYGDTGWRVSIEPQTPLISIGMVGYEGHEEPCWLRSSVFMDYGEAYLFEPPAGGASDRARFWGVGWNLAANIGSHLDARLTVACPLLATTTTSAGDVHVYFGVGAQF
jgi:hemolysin activation/secretion protein